MKKSLALILACIFALTACALPAFASTTRVIWACSFDETVGDAAESGTISFTEGKIGSAAVFDGGSSLRLADGLVNSVTDFTCAAWVRFDAPAMWQRVLDWGTGTTQYAFLGLSSPTDLRFALKQNADAAEEQLNAVGAVTAGAWTHIAITQSGNVRSLYVNGVCADRAVVRTTLSDLGATAHNFLGQSQFVSDPYLNGAIDNFSLTDAASAQMDILTLMLDGLTEAEALERLQALAVPGDLSRVKADLTLFTVSSEGFSLTWETSDEAHLTADGVVTRPQSEDAEVILTAVAAVGEATLRTEYPAVVVAMDAVDAVITIDADEKGVDISPDMIGLFFEDINYAADGGLYAELVSNRSFEAVNAQASTANPEPIPGYCYAAVGNPAMEYLTDAPLNANNPTYLRLTARAGEGFTNTCYDGFPTKAGERYDFSVYLRSDDPSSTVTAAIIEGETVCAEETITQVTGEWAKYEMTLVAETDCTNAILRVTLPYGGTVEFDMVSLFPQHTYNNRKNGLRADLVQQLKDLHPGFLRFPGGCIIEGYNLANRYDWKDTIGDVAERKQNWNRWQLHTSGDGRYGYCQTYGLGYYEYFLLCEDIGAKPVPVVNVGLACQYQTGEESSEEDLYNIYIQDALDLIEFANGDVTTEWGAKRAEMGHPEPFGLEIVGIGNEQWYLSSQKINFFQRYEAFEASIHAAYPDIKLVATSGPSSDGTHFSNAWNWLREHKGDEDFAYVVDEHYYKSPQWFYENINRYDDYDRAGFKVFAGEYASHDTNRPSNLSVALSIASFMTGLERNADIVEMASFAPLFKREGYTQWAPDLIGFDESGSYGTPDYYVQSMFANNHGSYTVKNKIAQGEIVAPLRGGTGIGTWETQAEFENIKITDNENGAELPIEPPTEANIEQYTVAAISASSSENEVNTPEKAIDGDLTTRWASNGRTELLLADLGEVKTVGKVAVASAAVAEREYYYELQLSEDNETWTTIFDGTNGSGNGALIDRFAGNIPARYIRLRAKGNSYHEWNSISELRVFGECEQTACAVMPSDTGEWSEDGGVWSQTSALQGAFHFAGASDMTNYTVSFRAKKTGGNEGFLIPFLVQNEAQYYMWNIGGWGNTLSAVQLVSGANKTNVTDYVPTVIEQDRWYDVAIEVTDTLFRCYLDGELQVQKTIQTTQGPIYTTTSFDENTGDLIVKLVNSSAMVQEAQLDWRSEKSFNPVADIEVLTADRVTDQNSVTHPDMVVPQHLTLSGADGSFRAMLPGNSFSVIRIHTKADSELIESVEVSSETLLCGATIAPPSEIGVTYRDGSAGTTKVQWDSVPAEFTSKAGVHTVEGTIDGSAKRAYHTVTIVAAEEVLDAAATCAVTEQTATASVQVDYNVSRKRDLTMYLAVYQNGALSAVQSKAMTILPGAGTATDQLTLPIESGATVKAFLWEGMTPICEAGNV